MVIGYGAYIVFMKFNARLLAMCSAPRVRSACYSDMPAFLLCLSAISDGGCGSYLLYNAYEVVGVSKHGTVAKIHQRHPYIDCHRVTTLLRGRYRKSCLS